MKLISSVFPRDDSADLLVHWLLHYRSGGIRQFHILVMPDQDGQAQMSERLMECLSSPDITTYHRQIPIASEQHRIDWYNKTKAELLTDQRMVFAVDVDEFVPAPGEIYDLACSENADFVRGRLVDRFALHGMTHPILDGIPIGAQFPICSHFTYEALGGLDSKIPLSKPDSRFRIGLHRLENEELLKRASREVQVAHFKWTEGVIGKLRARLARNKGDSQFIGTKYRQECTTFLDEFVCSETQINLTQIHAWYQTTV